MLEVLAPETGDGNCGDVFPSFVLTASFAAIATIGSTPVLGASSTTLDALDPDCDNEGAWLPSGRCAWRSCNSGGGGECCIECNMVG